MPPGQVLALADQAVGAGIRQPVDLADIARRQPHAVRHQFLAMRIILAPAIAQIELPAGRVGEEELAGIIVDQLVETAFAAAVAQAFPLRPGHLAELGRLPKRQGIGHLPFSAGYLPGPATGAGHASSMVRASGTLRQGEFAPPGIDFLAPAPAIEDTVMPD